MLQGQALEFVLMLDGLRNKKQIWYHIYYTGFRLTLNDISEEANLLRSPFLVFHFDCNNRVVEILKNSVPITLKEEKTQTKKYKTLDYKLSNTFKWTVFQHQEDMAKQHSKMYKFLMSAKSQLP